MSHHILNYLKSIERETEGKEILRLSSSRIKKEGWARVRSERTWNLKLH